MSTSPDLFELVNAQNINMQEFLSDVYNFEWKRNKTVCPFHGDDSKSPNFSYSPKLNTCKCFACNEAGDLINFIVKYKEVSKINACKEILNALNIPFEEDNTTVETKEEMEARQKAFDDRKKQNELNKSNKDKANLDLKKKAISTMTKKAHVFSQDLDLFNHAEPLLNLVSNQSTTFLDWLDLYVGWDKKHETLVVLNRILDDKKTTYNLKHREKFQWDDNKKIHLENRTPGKWISNIDSTTYAFPYEYYLEKSKEDNTIFITEGEKDALNLLSYDINVLTLGGVSNSWDEHKQLLKDKTVYIWFDNDNAGYEASINRYNEIKEVAKEVYIIVFFHIDPSLSKKYDISDYLHDKKFKTKEEILHAISYCSYKLTTTLIEEIEEYTGLDLKKYYFNQAIKKFSDIKKQWLKKDKDNIPINVTSVKGEKDITGLSDFFDKYKIAKKDKRFNFIKEELLDKLVVVKADNGKNIDNVGKDNEDKLTELIDIFDSMVSNYDTLHKDYSQTHISDMVTSFEAMAKRTDNTFAKFNGGLAIWTGSYYHALDEAIDDIKRFILKGWMPLSRVDKKKQSTANVEKILEDVFTGAISLNEIKANQEGMRIVNFTNGTLFINEKGKITFKKVHSKADGVTNILDFDYDEKATCPKWVKFLTRVLPDEKDRATLMEFIGYCFLPSHKYEAFLYLHGKSGANGKSVIMDVVKLFFGKENTSSLDLQDFEGHKLEALENKIINIGSEVDGKGLNKGQLPKLKALTATNDDISIDPKNLKPRTLESHHQPKLIFSGQNTPNPSTMDDGVFRRMLLLTFNSEIKDDEKIRDLSQRFNDEMSGILLLALKYLNNLTTNGKFTKSQTLLNNIEDYKDQTNPIRRYISDCLEKDNEIMVPKDFLYNHYKEYMTEKGNMPLSSAKFFARLKEEMKEIQDLGQLRVDVPNIEKDRPRFIAGVYCNSSDVFSFRVDKDEIQTKSINYDIKSKQIVVKIEKDEEIK